MYRVILIDDEPYTLEDMRTSFPFAKYSFAVTDAFTSAEDALAPILSDPPDLIITDIRMQTTSGLDLAAICRKNNIQSRIVLLSGHQEFEYVQEAFRQNVFFYMLKPIDDEQACDVLKRVHRSLQDHPMERVRHYSNDAFGRALEYIENNYTSSLPVESVAEMLFISKNYLSDVFTKRLGITFTQYRHSLRIQEAKRLLAETDESVTEIAYSVGYNSESYFCAMFKRVAGVTPQQYRTAQQAETQQP
ncbi:MAG: helix-turn-helix domain-containing protein [Clostridia bacterium]|nr:helix-turn-helix domain-containing protein [Clostridia bacterium]MDD6041977.1 helix-turn-helix domain-containing protein [Clostridia bacterium]